MTLVSASNISFPNNFLGTMMSDEEREISQKLLEKSCYCVNRGVWIYEVCEYKRKNKNICIFFKKSLQWSKGKMWFSTFTCKFSFLNHSPWQQSLPVLDESTAIIFSATTLGETPGGRSWNFKGVHGQMFQLGCSQGFKTKQITEEMWMPLWGL